ncbi:MAG: hypothetical protein ACE5H9_01735 [Anaerolineae bacterium]
MKTLANLGQEFGQYVIQLTAELMGGGEPKSLSEMERHIRQMLLKLGRFLLGAWLAMLVEPYPIESVPCQCGGQASFQFNRAGTLLTIVGQVEYKRPYYLCANCQQGVYPLDQQLGLRPGQMSAELESLSGMTGAQLPFGQGSNLFEALTLVSLSDHSLAKATQTMGAAVRRLEAEWLAHKSNNGWLSVQSSCTALWIWNGQLDAVIHAFERLTEHPRAGEAATKPVTYFTNNRHRMNYPEYRAKGYQIGSGTIESGCKQIVTQRLKVAGAIWDQDNAIKTAKAREALLSGQWQTLTSRREHLALPLAV